MKTPQKLSPYRYLLIISLLLLCVGCSSVKTIVIDKGTLHPDNKISGFSLPSRIIGLTLSYDTVVYFDKNGGTYFPDNKMFTGLSSNGDSISHSIRLVKYVHLRAYGDTKFDATLIESDRFHILSREGEREISGAAVPIPRRIEFNDDGAFYNDCDKEICGVTPIGEKVAYSVDSVSTITVERLDRHQQKLYMGYMLGATISSPHSDNNSSEGFPSGNLKYNFYTFTKYRINEFFSFQVQLGISGYGFNRDYDYKIDTSTYSVNDKIDLYNLELPLAIHLSPMQTRELSTSLYAGISYNRNISAKIEHTNVRQNTDSPSSYTLHQDVANVSESTISLITGVELLVPGKRGNMFVNIRYSQGITDLFSDNIDHTATDYRSRYIANNIGHTSHIKGGSINIDFGMIVPL